MLLNDHRFSKDSRALYTTAKINTKTAMKQLLFRFLYSSERVCFSTIWFHNLLLQQEWYLLHFDALPFLFWNEELIAHVRSIYIQIHPTQDMILSSATTQLRPRKWQNEHTTAGIRWCSHTQLLICQFVAYIWQSGWVAHLGLVNFIAHKYKSLRPLSFRDTAFSAQIWKLGGYYYQLSSQARLSGWGARIQSALICIGQSQRQTVHQSFYEDNGFDI